MAKTKEKEQGNRKQIIAKLLHAYEMEIETAVNYIAHSINLDGVRAEEIKKALLADITAEIGHAQMLGNRIKQLSGRIFGSQQLTFNQSYMQPGRDSTDVIYVIKGVIKAEIEAINHYRDTIRLCEGNDWVTQDLCVRLMADEEEHLSLFNGFLKEYEK